ncbi:hypothetical protein JCM11491_004101 [Sporobolomyces phaffii]
MNPPKLDYSHSTYLTISTQVPPESILPPPSSPTSSFSQSSQESSRGSSTDAGNPHTALSYVGPVGQLANEHIYELSGVPSSDPPARQAEDVKQWLAAREGVKGVEVMVPQTRHRRRFEC